jgi:hypothetical protein
VVELDVVEGLLNSMDEAVKRIEIAYSSQDVDYVNKLRLFIFNLHENLDKLINGTKHV